MQTHADLNRFLDAQQSTYTDALAEIRRGRKQTHWMWYIFPQIAGLGFSQTAHYYAIQDLAEAKAYVNHPVLGSRLVEITRVLLDLEGKTAYQIMGSPDDLKLRSSMTLFSLAKPTESVFQEVLDKYFQGESDERTLALVKKKTDG
ncbi:DUF1810 domain-containing protein [Spirosoma sp. RP8]|uniref:DUF1810 domain-containing protein n=1 Tax=Spirosoma liriopis TaxID=2937440 RepID=A0ABT0HUX3_9BACT|nr:DUF1810 domain-containing protein [Spirosoma liriopis]MCK8495996.1 DUF1810 domain-containing protein [Spirosoma liriopis]